MLRRVWGEVAAGRSITLACYTPPVTIYGMEIFFTILMQISIGFSLFHYLVTNDGMAAQLSIGYALQSCVPWIGAPYQRLALGLGSVWVTVSYLLQKKFVSVLGRCCRYLLVLRTTVHLHRKSCSTCSRVYTCCCVLITVVLLHRSTNLLSLTKY